MHADDAHVLAGKVRVRIACLRQARLCAAWTERPEGCLLSRQLKAGKSVGIGPDAGFDPVGHGVCGPGASGPHPLRGEARPLSLEGDLREIDRNVQGYIDVGVDPTVVSPAAI